MKYPAIDSDRVRRNFSCHASEYDRYARVQKRVAAALVEMLAGRELGSGPVLEVGTGTGEVARLLARRTADLSLVISDIAHGMTRYAAARLPSAVPIDCDAHALPFRGASFDLIVSSSVFQWMNDLSAVFTEASRILWPGGVFAFALYGERTLWELRQSHRLALEEEGSRGASHTHLFPAEDEIRCALLSSGFVIERLFSADEVERHPDVPALLRGLKKIGAQNAAGNRPAGLASRRLMNRMMDLYVGSFGEKGSIPATYHVIYALARQGRR